MTHSNAGPQRHQVDPGATPRDRGDDRPDVSIIVACHNAAETLEDTLASLQAQTHGNWEAVCIDDGSTDRTPELLAGFAEADPRIRWLRIPHAGQPATKNRGVQLARADRVMVLDADDVARPAALATLLRAASAVDDRTIVAPGYELLDRQGRALSIFRFPAVPNFCVDVLLRGNCLPPMSLVSKAALGERPFDETLPTSIDWNVWLGLAHAGARCVSAPRALFGYRLHAGSLSHNADQLLASGRRVLARWLPRARQPQAVRDVPHRLACEYGAVALASGAPDAVRRYFAPLAPLEPAADTYAALAHSIYSAFEFVRGAAGQTWREHADAWLAEIRAWLDDGPLAAHAAAIWSCFPRVLQQRRSRIDSIREFLACRSAQRVVVYGAGMNGQMLLEQLRADTSFGTYRLAVADDAADAAMLALLDLPREDPRRWRSWPDQTVAVITPNDCAAMRRALLRAGGREGTDFVVWASAAEEAMAVA